jgi:hypothetical protein
MASCGRVWRAACEALELFESERRFVAAARELARRSWKTFWRKQDPGKSGLSAGAAPVFAETARDLEDAAVDRRALGRAWQGPLPAAARSVKAHKASGRARHGLVLVGATLAHAAAARFRWSYTSPADLSAEAFAAPERTRRGLVLSGATLAREAAARVRETKLRRRRLQPRLWRLPRLVSREQRLRTQQWCAFGV